jgi:hypothetical protein
VRRDEAAAQAAEEANEERMQEADAARRLAILRGEEPPPLPEEELTTADPAAGALVKRDRFPGEKRKRKRAGEDDTDFEMRLARERAAEVAEPRRRGSDAPLELAGLLDPAEQKGLVRPPPGREEEAAEKRRKAERAANPVLKDALGIKEDPWFVKRSGPEEVGEERGRDAWGNEDPGRRARDVVRLDKNDPLSMMKRGAAKVREVTQERKKEMEERDRELKMLRREERRREKRRRPDGKAMDDGDDLEGFTLDAPEKPKDRSTSERRHRTKHRHSERRRDGERGHPEEDRQHRSSRSESDRHRHRHRHRHRSREGREQERERQHR